MSRTTPRVLTDSEGHDHHFPPQATHQYAIVEGRIQTRSLEAHIVDHCNLTCAECCSLSPMLPRWFASPESFAQDLEVAARMLAPRVFKLVGGEPLMHPQIATMVRIAKESGISERVSVTTNGVLLKTMSDEFWQSLDAMTVSLYPRPALPEALMSLARDKASRFGVTLNWKRQDDFVLMNKEDRREHEHETKEIYTRCWLRERCHLVRDGVFYTCTRPAHMQTLHGESAGFSSDGFSLVDASTRPEALLAYLQKEKALEACAYCHGGDAQLAPHRLLTASELTTLVKRNT